MYKSIEYSNRVYTYNTCNTCNTCREGIRVGEGDSRVMAIIY